MNVTKADLDAQLMELQKVMENMGLEKKPASGAEAKGSEPLAGFVSASKPEPEDTIKSVESELLDLNMNKETGTFTIEGCEAVITPLPEQAARFARVLTHGELRSLLSAFKESSWTPPLVAKILKVYVIAKRSAAHLEMLKAKHASQRGGSMENLTEKDPGAQPSLVCSNCNAPWGSFATCMLCKRTSPIDMSTTPLSVIEVDGQTWQLRFSDSGPTWVLSGAKATKEAGYIEVGDLGRLPPAVASGADPGLVSFSEQVAESQRVTLRQPIETFGKDDIFHPKGERPPALEEQDETQSAVIFHPKAIQVVKFKANLLSTEAADMEAVTQERKRQKLEEQHARESQAAGLRKLDLQQFRAFLKRKHEESGVTTSYEAILAAQTTQDQAAQTGKLSSTPSRYLPVNSFTLWPEDLQRAWEGNLFAPSQGPEGPEQFDFNGLKTTYLAMKDFLKDNKCPISGRRLLQEFPTTQLDIYTYAEGTEMIPAGRLARLLPEESAERKFAVLVSILSYHMGEVRAWGGVWVQRTCPLNAPPELLSLETRTGPLGNTSYVPQTYTGERREAPWASGEAGSLWH